MVVNCERQGLETISGSFSNAFIGNQSMCHCCEGQSPVAISCLSLEKLGYFDGKKEKDKQEGVLREKSIEDNLRNSVEE